MKEKNPVVFSMGRFWPVILGSEMYRPLSNNRSSPTGVCDHSRNCRAESNRPGRRPNNCDWCCAEGRPPRYSGRLVFRRWWTGNFRWRDWAVDDLLDSRGQRRQTLHRLHCLVSRDNRCHNRIQTAGKRPFRPGLPAASDPANTTVDPRRPCHFLRLYPPNSCNTKVADQILYSLSKWSAKVGTEREMAWLLSWFSRTLRSTFYSFSSSAGCQLRK